MAPSVVVFWHPSHPFASVAVFWLHILSISSQHITFCNRITVFFLMKYNFKFPHKQCDIMNSLPNIMRHILKPNRSHLDLVWMPSSRGDQPCTYPFLLRATARYFPKCFFSLFQSFSHLSINVLFFLTYFFVCRQMFPQMKFRLTGLDPKVSRSIASGIFSPLVVGNVFFAKLLCRRHVFYPIF